MHLLLNQRGSQLVEFALVVPVLLLLVFGSTGVFMTQHGYGLLAKATQDAAVAGGYAHDGATCKPEADAAAQSMQTTLSGSTVAGVQLIVICRGTSDVTCTGTPGSSMSCPGDGPVGTRLSVEASGQVDISAVSLGLSINSISTRATAVVDPAKLPKPGR